MGLLGGYRKDAIATSPEGTQRRFPLGVPFVSGMLRRIPLDNAATGGAVDVIERGRDAQPTAWAKGSVDTASPRRASGIGRPFAVIDCAHRRPAR